MITLCLKKFQKALFATGRESFIVQELEEKAKSIRYWLEQNYKVYFLCVMRVALWSMHEFLRTYL